MDAFEAAAHLNEFDNDLSRDDDELIIEAPAPQGLDDDPADNELDEYDADPNDEPVEPGEIVPREEDLTEAQKSGQQIREYPIKLVFKKGPHGQP